jgi:hypothetical protein
MGRGLVTTFWKEWTRQSLGTTVRTFTKHSRRWYGVCIPITHGKDGLSILDTMVCSSGIGNNSRVEFSRRGYERYFAVFILRERM